MNSLAEILSTMALALTIWDWGFVMHQTWEAIKPFLTFSGGLMALAGALTAGFIDYVEHQPPISISADTRPWLKLRIVALVFAIFGGVLVLIGSRLDSREQELLQAKIAALSGETLAWVTGGEDGFVSVKAMGHLNDMDTITFSVHNEGSYPSYDVAIKFRDMDLVNEYWKSRRKGNWVYFTGTDKAFLEESEAVGTIYWNRPIMYPDPRHFLVATFSGTKKNKRRFFVQVFTRNSHQEMHVLAIRIAEPNDWRFAYKVMARSRLGKSLPDEEFRDSEFPLNAQGKVGW